MLDNSEEEKHNIWIKNTAEEKIEEKSHNFHLQTIKLNE